MSSTNTFAHMSVAQIQAGLREGQFSATEIARESIENAQATDKNIHAFLEFTPKLALKAAEKIDAKIAAGSLDACGALAGVPVAFKDNMNLSGTHTTCGSRMLENYVSPYTATCVSKILQAGALPLGKLNMDEFAFGSSTETSAFGKTCNPWDLSRVPGGSSGGSAAAVAAGMCTLTLGSDTGGSIRQPGSFCGCVAVKPTYGVVSRYGVVAFGSSLDQVGPFARNVRDAALAMNVLSGRDALDCTSQDVKTDFTKLLDAGVSGMNIGVVPEFMEAAGLAAEVKQKVEEAISKLEAAGANLVEIELPNVHASISAYYVIAPCEAFSNLARFDSVRYGYCDPGHKDLGGQYEASRSVGFGEEARRRIMLGSYLLSAGVYEKYYYPAQQVRTLITQDFNNAFERVDCILAPAAPRTAFKFGEISDPAQMYLNDMYTISINIAGNGGMSMPIGFGADTGLPVGLQIMAPHFKDEVMLQVAAALEAEYGAAPVAGADGSQAAAGATGAAVDSQTDGAPGAADSENAPTSSANNS